MSYGYHRSIDGLRGVALLLVLMFHQDIVYFGWTGIILFFVLSGYLITKVLMAEKEKALPMTTRFKNFWMRRILRIFPVYYLYLFMLLIGLAANVVPAEVIKEIPWLFTYTYNFYLIAVYDHTQPSFLAGHFWSLSVEEQFYLFYPFLAFFCSRKQLKFSIVALILFSIFFRVYVDLYPSKYANNEVSCFSGFSDYHPFNYLDSFLCGAAIFIFRLDKIRSSLAYLFFIFALLATIAGGLFIYLEMNRDKPFNLRSYLSDFGIVAHYCENMYRVWSQVNLNLLFSSMLLLLLLPVKNFFHSWMKKIFELQPLVFLGKISYGTYIFHAIVIWLLADVFNYGSTFTNKYLFFLVCLSCSLIVASLIYYLYEKKFLAMKEKFR